jgi:hypothetical protein
MTQGVGICLGASGAVIALTRSQPPRLIALADLGWPEGLWEHPFPQSEPATVAKRILARARRQLALPRGCRLSVVIGPSLSRHLPQHVLARSAELLARAKLSQSNVIAAGEASALRLDLMATPGALAEAAATEEAALAIGAAIASLAPPPPPTALMPAASAAPLPLKPLPITPPFPSVFTPATPAPPEAMPGFAPPAALPVVMSVMPAAAAPVMPIVPVADVPRVALMPPAEVSGEVWEVEAALPLVAMPAFGPTAAEPTLAPGAMANSANAALVPVVAQGYSGWALEPAADTHGE